MVTALFLTLRIFIELNANIAKAKVNARSEAEFFAIRMGKFTYGNMSCLLPFKRAG